MILLIGPFLVLGPATDALVVDVFQGDEAVVELNLRPPTSSTGTAKVVIPADTFVIDGSVDIEGRPHTTQGGVVHNLSEDFEAAASLEHVVVENGTVRLEDVEDMLEASADDGWDDGEVDGLVAGDALTLEESMDLAFMWDRVLCNATNDQEGVRLAVDSDGITHAIWEDNRDGADIYYARSDDGLVYTHMKYLDHTSDRRIPQLGADMAVGPDDSIHVVFGDGRTTPMDLDVFYTRSTDHGLTFQQEVRVDSGGDVYQGHPAVAVDADDHVHIAWEDDRDGNTSIYYSRDLGTEIRVSNSTDGYQYQPDIAVDSDGWVHVTWRDNRSTSGNFRIYHSRLPPGGSEFQDEEKVYGGPLGSEQSSAVMAPASDGRLFVAWQDDRTFGIYNVYMAASDDGATFGTPARISPSLIKGYNPSLWATTDAVHIVWYDYREGNANIYYSNTTDGGQNFMEAVRVNTDNGTTFQRSPAVTVPDGGGWPRIAWADNRQHGSGDLFTTVGVPGFLAEGTLDIWYDLEARPFNFTGAGWDGYLPPGATVTIEGRTSVDNATWSSAVDLIGVADTLQSDRYLQVSVTLATRNRAYTPALDDIWVGYRRYATSGTIVSTSIDADGPVAWASTAVVAVGAGSINVSLSTDDGSSWVAVGEEGEGGEVTFDDGGDSLSYKVDLFRGDGGTPVLDRLSMDYSTESHPEDVTLDVGDETVWEYSGPFARLVTVDGLEDAINAFISTVADDGSGEVVFTFGVTSEGRGTVVLSNLSLDLAQRPEITGSGPGARPDTIEGEEVSFWVSASEPDGRPITYTWKVDGEVVDGATNSTYAHTPPFIGGSSRTVKVEVEVSNGYLSAAKEWSLVVDPGNRPPVITAHVPELNAIVVEKKEGTVEFSVDATDPDGADLSYTWEVDGTEVAGVDLDTYLMDPLALMEGDHDVMVTVSDGTLKASHSWSVIVIPVEDGDGDVDGGDDTGLIVLLMVLAVIVVCGIIFMETYRRSLGSQRKLQKRLVDEVEKDLEAEKELAEVKKEERMMERGKVPKKYKVEGKGGKKVDWKGKGETSKKKGKKRKKVKRRKRP